MTENRVDLASLFGTVAASLAQNQATLDEADSYNHDHGTNMVQTFQTIAGALEQKKDSSDSAALTYAAKQLAKQSTSGSSKLYAENLSLAADQFKRKKVDQKGALQLLQTMIGGAQPEPAPSQPAGGDLLSALLGSAASGSSASQSAPSAGVGDLLGALLGGAAGGSAGQSAPSSGGGDLLGALLGGITGGGSAGSASQQPASTGSDDLLGALLGGLAGGGSGAGSTGGQQQGLNMQTLLSAGLAYMQAKQSGKDNLQALIQAFMAGSKMGQDPHRQQSTQMVVQYFLQALSAQAK